MQVTKPRARSETNGLVPMGQYFARIAAELEQANAREAKLRAKRDAEVRYRRASAARANTYARSETQLSM